jgi:hypothetical protein
MILMISDVFNARSEAIAFPASDATRLEYEAGRKRYKDQHKALKQEFAEALAEEYLGDVPVERRAAVGEQTFKLAWDRGHDSGFSSVENEYITLSEYATAVAAAIYTYSAVAA